VRAISYTKSALLESRAPEPQPGTGELLIRVRAAGITPTELLWYPTTHTKGGAARDAAVPCHEFSGVVAAVGDTVGTLEIGHEVFGMNDWFAEGALAEFCVAPWTSVAPKPTNLTHAEAASAPIGALTAWQGLFDRGHLQPGERILVHGGAGAVGLFVVQLARRHGAHVIATASARNLEFVGSLGAHQVLDYRATPFESAARDLDLVFDTVGGETLRRSWPLLKPGGRMVTVAAEAADGVKADPRAKDAFFIVEPNQKQLSQIAALLQEGSLRPVVDTVVPIARAAEAFSGAIERRGRGKLVAEIL
jgi:NADPH:quinone reductase-like Zn-dependent oxidoreductase